MVGGEGQEGVNMRDEDRKGHVHGQLALWAWAAVVT